VAYRCICTYQCPPYPLAYPLCPPSAYTRPQTDMLYIPLKRSLHPKMEVTMSGTCTTGHSGAVCRWKGWRGRCGGWHTGAYAPTSGHRIHLHTPCAPLPPTHALRLTRCTCASQEEPNGSHDEWDMYNRSFWGCVWVEGVEEEVWGVAYGCLCVYQWPPHPLSYPLCPLLSTHAPSIRTQCRHCDTASVIVFTRCCHSEYLKINQGSTESCAAHSVWFDKHTNTCMHNDCSLYPP